MTQHDYNIANQTFPNTRTDLNNVFSAILSSNSGASAPSTTSPYMIWADTTNSLFKYRNSADSDWISWLTTDGKHLCADGSASSPGLSFSSDTNTGIYRVGSDSIGISLGGSQKAVFDSSGNLGVSSTSPQDRLDLGNASGGYGIAWGGSTGTNHYTTVWSEYGSGSLFLGAGVKGDKTAGQVLSSYTGTIGMSTIELVAFGSSAGDIIFSGNSASARTKDAVVTPTEIMRVNASSANVGIGTNSPVSTAILDMQSTTKGVRFPNMTTTQRNAISSPSLGIVIYNTTTNKLNVYTGSWEAIVSA